MKKYNLGTKLKIGTILWCLLMSIITTNAQITQFVDGEVYIKIKDNSSISLGTNVAVSTSSVSFLSTLSQSYPIQSINRSFYAGDVATGIASTNPQIAAAALKISKILRVKLTNPTQIDAFISQTQTYNTDVEYVEKVPMFSTGLTPNDLGTNSTTGTGQWALYKVNAQTAWDITTGSSSVIVAVVDNAIDTSHPDLVNNVVAGRDVADGDNNTIPSNVAMNHGTHVAGIVGAQTNNGTGIASIGYNVRVMPIKTARNTDGTGSISFGYEGIAWAAQNGARVINCSWGGSTSIADGGNIDATYPTQRDVMNFAVQNGCVIVCAAGNSNSSNLFIPAGFTNVISVASTGTTDARSSFSNFGTWIDISAPGESIYSTLPSNSYAFFNGTSMASPLVAGIVGLMYSINPNLTRDQCEACLKSSATNINSINPGFTGRLGGGRVDARGAVLCAQNLVATCSTTLNLTTPISSGTQTFRASNNITSTSQISGAGTNITYRAASQIVLNQGFRVSSGSLFRGVISACNVSTRQASEATLNVDEEKEGIELSAYPNPTSNGEVIIQYTLPEDGNASINLANMSGINVKSIVEDKFHEKGTYKVKASVSDLKTGIYLYILQGDKVRLAKKLVIE